MGVMIALENVVRSFYPNERERLHELLEKTLKLGESNSVLCVGSQSNAKALVQLVAEDVLRENCDGILVELCGLLQVNDRIAIQEIARQLKLENVIEGRVHGSFSENLQFLLESVKGDKNEVKSVIFVLDHFDLFCNHKNQTLLYNLFDICQNAQAPICVVGVTGRLDVIELLEKRVKSRFSHRIIYLFQCESTPDYIRTFLKEYLICDPCKAPYKKWKKHITQLLRNPGSDQIIEEISMTCCGSDTLKNIAMLLYSTGQNNKLSLADFTAAVGMVSQDSKMLIINSLSYLELALVIAMMHLSELHDGEPFNFEMVYHHYLKFAREKSGMRNLNRQVTMKAFDNLQTLEVIIPVERGRAMLKEYQLFCFLLLPSEVKKVLESSHSLPTDLVQWAASSVF